MDTKKKKVSPIQPVKREGDLPKTNQHLEKAADTNRTPQPGFAGELFVGVDIDALLAVDLSEEFREYC
jgi:hypothetical protein